MKRDQSFSARDMRLLLERAKSIPELPSAVRARVLARASASASASTALPSVRPLDPIPARPRFALAKLAPALPVAIAIGVGALALSHRRPSAMTTGTTHPTNAPVLAPVEPFEPPAALTAPSAVAPIVPKPAPERSSRATAPPESYAAELSLLRRAHTAYAARDFSGALGFVAEHARRFPNGRLAEEREALRVRSLASSGRTTEAQRAAAAFANRFPRSVLLPRIQKLGE